MKKIIILVAALVAVIGTLSAGTFAYFTDTANSTGNIITAGTLYLDSGAPQAQVGLSTATPGGSKAILLDATTAYVYPGTWGMGQIKFQNLGNLGGTLDLKTSGTLTNVNGSVTKFQALGHGAAGDAQYDTQIALWLDKDNDGWDSGDVALLSDGTTVNYSAPTTGTATSGSTLTIINSSNPFTDSALVGKQVTVTGKGTRVITANTTSTITVAAPFSGAVSTDDYSIDNGIKYDTIYNYGNASVKWNAAQTIAQSAYTTLSIGWTVPTTAGNELQGDSTSFDINFQLRQAEAPGF
jgi:predicted ribosomally synthesized peptide with SipW-like signal peptide